MARATRPRSLIDSSVLIDAFRGREAAMKYLADLREDGGFGISAVTVMEVLVGCRDRREFAQSHAWFLAEAVVPITEPISHRAVELVATYALSHRLQPPTPSSPPRHSSTTGRCVR